MSLPETIFYRPWMPGSGSYGEGVPENTAPQPGQLGMHRGPVEVGEYRLVRTLRVTLAVETSVEEVKP